MKSAATKAGSAKGREELAALVGAIAAGERDALKALYDRTSAKLFGVSLRILGNEADAQDVLQEVYTTVWHKADRFDPARASAITWLALLTRSRAIDRLRARRAPNEGLDAASELADDGPSPLDLVERSQDAKRLADCLGELEDRARDMIRSAFFDGASYRELASQEGVPLPTMKSWIRRGLIRLKACLER